MTPPRPNETRIAHLRLHAGRLRVIRLALSFLAIASALAIILFSSSGWWIGVMTVFTVVNIVLWELQRTAQATAYRLIHQAAFRFCPTCEYPLPPAPADGTCPECGHGYTVESLKSAWAHTDRGVSARPDDQE